MVRRVKILNTMTRRIATRSISRNLRRLQLTEAVLNPRIVIERNPQLEALAPFTIPPRRIVRIDMVERERTQVGPQLALSKANEINQQRLNLEEVRQRYAEMFHRPIDMVNIVQPMLQIEQIIRNKVDIPARFREEIDHDADDESEFEMEINYSEESEKDDSSEKDHSHMGFKQPVPNLVDELDADTNITGSDNRSMSSRCIAQHEQQVADNQVIVNKQQSSNAFDRPMNFVQPMPVRQLDEIYDDDDEDLIKVDHPKQCGEDLQLPKDRSDSPKAESSVKKVTHMGFKRPVPGLIHIMDTQSNIAGSGNRSMSSQSIAQQLAENQAIVNKQQSTNAFDRPINIQPMPARQFVDDDDGDSSMVVDHPKGSGEDLELPKGGSDSPKVSVWPHAMAVDEQPSYSTVVCKPQSPARRAPFLIRGRRPSAEYKSKGVMSTIAEE